MSFTDKISSNNTASPDAISYKPMTPEVDGILDSGALVHILEFISMRSLNNNFLQNFCNAMSGNYTGSYSAFRYEGEPLFDKKKGIFQALPTSTIRNGFALSLFAGCHSGVVIDPSMVDFVFVQPNWAGNTPDEKYPGGIVFESRNIFNDEHFIKINAGTDLLESLSDGTKTAVPIERTAEDKKNLRDLFEDYFWKKYKEFFDKKELDWDNRLFTEEPLMSEILVNAPPESIKALIFHSDGHDPAKTYKPLEEREKGLMLTVLMQMNLEHNYNIKLPIIHYHSNFTLFPTIEFAPPTIKEVDIEMKKVAKVLNDDEKTRNIFKEFLGEEYVHKIMMGRAEGWEPKV